MGETEVFAAMVDTQIGWTTAGRNDRAMTNGPTIGYINVTPDIAKKWLQNNGGNRSLRESRISLYADDMRAGKWTFGADMICFGTDGTLLNGQHRLHAIVRTGCTITFAVQKNTPDDAMVNIDTGASRSASDALRWNGEINSSTLAAAVKLAMIYVDGRIYNDSRASISSGAVVSFIKANPELRESVATVGSYRPYIDCPPRALAVAHWIIANENGTTSADRFFHQLAHKGGEVEGSAILILDRRLREIKRTRAGYAPREYLALLIKAWNYYANDKSAKSLHMSQKGTFTIPPIERIRDLDKV